MHKNHFSKKATFAFLLALISSLSSGQTFEKEDSIKKSTSAVERYHEVLGYNQPIMYIAFPVIEPVLEREIRLENGEGKNGYWAEGHFGHRFVIYKGKDHSPSFFQRTRLSFDVSMLTRLTRDESSPLLPYSNRFGLGLDLLLSSLKKLKKVDGGMVWTTLQLHHYSNGQADSFFIEAPVLRNNYKGGDFSSNYWRAVLNISGNPNRKNLFLTGLGYQKEIDLGGPLSSSKQLNQYYGDGRVLFFFHWIKKPAASFVERLNKSLTNGNTIKREVRRELGVRTELEYLTGDMSLFNGEDKFRLGWHNYITYLPSVTNEVGFMIHTYLGRDYLNIRFDDVIFLASAGLYVCFK